MPPVNDPLHSVDSESRQLECFSARIPGFCGCSSSAVEVTLRMKSWCEVVRSPRPRSFRRDDWPTAWGQRVTHQPQPAPTIPRFKLSTTIDRIPPDDTQNDSPEGDLALDRCIRRSPRPRARQLIAYASRADVAAETATRLNMMPGQVVRTRIVSQIGLITVILGTCNACVSGRSLPSFDRLVLG